MQTAERCGTPRGHKAHRDRGEDPCDACRASWNAYMDERRKDPKVRSVEARSASARHAALQRLAREYPGLFAQVLTEERAKRGLGPSRVVGRS